MEDLTKYTPENVHMYRRWLNILSGTIHNAGKSFEGNTEKELGFKNVVLLDLMMRINLSIRGLEELFPVYAHNKDMRHSINLIMRTVLSDILTGLYLAQRYTDNKTFENEVKVMNLDFAKYSIFMYEHEHEMFGKTVDEVKVEMESMLQKYKESNPDLFLAEENFRIIKPAEVRETSDPKFFIDEAHRTKGLTEDNKYKSIKADSVIGRFSTIYIVFRYFSQYQHYSFDGRKTLRINDEFDLHKYLYSIFIINECVYMLLRLVGTDEKLLAPLKTISDDYNKLIEKNDTKNI